MILARPSWPSLIALFPAIVFAACAHVAAAQALAAADPYRERQFQVRPFLAGATDINKLGICYGPYREGQRPGGPNGPTDEELREDLRLMAKHWPVVRLYSSGEITERILQLCRQEKSPLRCILGAWLGGETEVATAGRAALPSEAARAANRREISDAIRLANDFPDFVVAVSVGNETQVHWSDHRIPPARLVEYLRNVRNATRVPVTTADDLAYWRLPESRAIADEVDFILCHIHPLWQGQQLGGAIDFLNRQCAELQQLHPNRQLVVGETGWATSFHPEGLQGELIKGKVGEAEQQVFYSALQDWVADSGFVTLWFEAFDEPWKGGPHPDEVEKHWGLFHVDRTPKPALAPTTPLRDQ